MRNGRRFIFPLLLSSGWVLPAIAEQPPQLPLPLLEGKTAEAQAAVPAPVFITTALPVAAENTGYSARIEASGQGPLTYSLIAGPEGLTLSSAGQLEWKPGFDSAGKHEVRLDVADPYGKASKTYSIEVANTNRAPVFNAPIPSRLKEGERYSFAIDASDPDGSPLTYKMQNAPAGLSLSKNVISWTPSYVEAGDYSFSLVIADTESATTQQVSFTVANTNRLPEWKTASLGKAKEGSPLAMQLEATDADGTALVYKTDSAPAGMTLSPGGSLAWLPGYASAGVANITLSVSDGEAVVPKNFSLPVENTNRPPVIAGKPVTETAEAAQYRYTIEATDADGETLTFKKINAPGSMLLENSELVWVPSYEQAGSYPVEIEVADAAATIRQKFMLTVKNTNRPPVFTPLAANTLSVNENQEWKNLIAASDADRQPVKIEMAEGPKGMVFVKNTLSWKPDFEQAGDHPIVLVASDGESRVEYNITLHVNNVNRLPAFSSKPVLQAREVESYRYVVEASDPDRTPLVFSLVKAPGGMAVSGNIVSWTPDHEQAGSHAVILQMTDGEARIEQPFTITVANTNRAPVFNSQPQAMTEENTPYRYSVNVSDPDRTPVQLKLAKAPQGMTLENNNLAWTPDFESAGTHAVELQASDGETVTSQPFSIQVKNTNRIPVIASKPALGAIESIAYSYRVEAGDADRQPLAIGLKQAPAGMSVSDGLIQWLPDYDQQGKKTVIVTVSDGESTVEQPFAIDVINTNRAPDLDPISDQTVVAGKTFKYPFRAFDVDGDPVRIRLEHGPEGMIIKEGNLLFWETGKKSAGSYTVILGVSDGDLPGSRHFELTVTPND